MIGLSLVLACSRDPDHTDHTDAAELVGDTVEGFGAGAVGGDVTGAAELVVTALVDDGEGSLRAVLAGVTGPARVSFGVQGDIALASTVFVPSHVTIDGSGATITGNGLHLLDVEDVVIRDLSFRDVAGPGDAITLERSHTVAIVHCAFDNAGLDPALPDEFVSVVWGATDVTIAWSSFRNTDKVFLFGNGDAPAEIDGEIRVTLHDNVLVGNGRRHPFLRFGQVDAYNSLIADWSYKHEKTYGVRAADGGRIRLENDWIEQHSDAPELTLPPELAVALEGSPWVGAVAETDDARIDAIGLVVNDERVVIEDTGDAFERPYPATLQTLDAGWRAQIEEVVGPR
jgi:pectate lyase